MTRRGGSVYVACQLSCHWMSEVSSSIWSHYHVKRRGWCLKEGDRMGEERSRKAICILQAYSFSHTHTHSLLQPLLPQAGQFTVRLFNFAEIGLWQLCHADEKVLRRVAACQISSISAPILLSHLLLHLLLLFWPHLLVCLLSSFSDVKPFSSNIHSSPSLSNWYVCVCVCQGQGGALIDVGKRTKVITGSCFLFHLHWLL